MSSARAARARLALDRLYESRPADARALDQLMADLRAENSRYRRQAREAEAALAALIAKPGGHPDHQTPAGAGPAGRTNRRPGP